jgi:peptidoglycan/LPS O-acetylase OafA/YrhL
MLMHTPMSAPAAPSRAPASRLAWLDLLRGIAAMVVALHHATYYYIPHTRARMGNWIDPGTYGVLVFFLVSGYIVPASLERHGKLRGFWASRLLRIYPLLLVALAATVLPFLLGIRGLRAGLDQYDPLTAVVAHLTMLQDVLDVPNAINVLWTLSYEMAFYLLVAALFVVRVHRRSAPIAILLASASVLVGGILPKVALSQGIGISWVVGLSAVVFAAAIAGAVSGSPLLRTLGALTGGALAIVLVSVNSRIAPWQGLAILAVMFLGTALYRAEHGQIARRSAVVACGLVLIGVIWAGVWHARLGMSAEQATEFRTYWPVTVLLAAVTFAVGWSLRHRRIPRWLTGLGTISFSLYLLHPVLLLVSDQFGGTPHHDDALRLAVFVAALVLLSCLTHRYIEMPFQRLGRRLTARAAIPATVSIDAKPQEPAPVG